MDRNVSLPEIGYNDEPCLQRKNLNTAIRRVMERMSSPLEFQTTLRCKLREMSETDVCTYMDNTYDYLSDKFLANDREAMQVVLCELADGKF